MAGAIDRALIQRLQHRLGIGRAAVYRRIQQTVNQFQLDRRAAAILLASQHHINTARFSTPEDRAAIREAVRGNGTHAGVGTQSAPAPLAPSAPRTRGRSTSRARIGQKPSTVWLVHGRDEKAASQLRDFLRALGLRVLEFTQAILRTRQGSPYVGSVLERGIGDTGAVVVLFTPDDEAKLRAPFRTSDDSAQESKLTPQPRLNVVFEAGMAIQHNPRKTVLVQMGRMRSFSNITGRHVVQLHRGHASRQELATKLKAAGCSVDTDGSDWLSRGDFGQTVVPARKQRPRRPKKRRRRY